MKHGTVEAVCISSKKGEAKHAVGRAVLREGWGIEGDAHAGNGKRQVSLLAAESIERMKEKIPDLEPGAFAENLVTRGIDISALSPGDRVAIGSGALLHVTQIGKECHSSCRIKTLTGDCIMPKEGVFAVVLRGGTVAPGDAVTIECGTARSLPPDEGRALGRSIVATRGESSGKKL